MVNCMQPSEQYPGRLFVVEGIDGSGKSTQIDLLRKWLLAHGYSAFFSEWNSSPLVKRTTRRGKNRHLLNPLTFSLIHATDFAAEGGGGGAGGPVCVHGLRARCCPRL